MISSYRIDKSMLKWGPIVLPVGKNKLFNSSKCAGMRKSSIPVSSLPFMRFNGRTVAGLYDVVIMVSPFAASVTTAGAQSAVTTTNNNNNSTSGPIDAGSAATLNSSAYVLQEAFYFRVPKSKAASLSRSSESPVANQRVERLESFDGDEGAKPAPPPSNVVHKAKIVLHRFMLSQGGVYNDVGGVFATSSTAPSADSERDGAVAAADSTPNSRATQEPCIGSDMDEKVDDSSDVDESRPFPLSPRRSSGDTPTSRVGINASPAALEGDVNMYELTICMYYVCTINDCMII